MKVQLASVNINGLMKGDKVKNFGQWIKKKKVQCVLVQEMTRGSGNIAHNIRSGHWNSDTWVIEGKVGIWIDNQWG